MKRLIFGVLMACGGSAPVVTVPTTSTSTSTSASTSTTSNAKVEEPCIEIDAEKLDGKPTTLEGIVDCGKHSHPNGSTFDFCYIALRPERCVTGMTETKSVDQVQLAGDPDFTKMKGQHIRVHGSPFPEHTAWHVRPVLIMVDKVLP